MVELTLLVRLARLRALGGLLFCLALGLFGVGIFAILSGSLPAGRIMPCILALGLSLASFGTADDSLLATLKGLRRAGALPARWAQEWQAEVGRRPRRLKEIHASPRAVLLIPLLASLALVLVGRMLALALAPGGLL